MPKLYKYLDLTYRDDTIAAALISREQEIFHYEFDLENFVHMLANTLNSELDKDLQKRIIDTNRELAKSKAIYNALLAQVTDQSAHLAAVARVRAKK